MLNNIGPAGAILIAVVVLILFGRGRVGALIGELGSGVSSFRRGLREEASEIAASDAPIERLPQ